MTEAAPRGRRPPVRAVTAVVGLLILVVLAFAANRLRVDVPQLLSGTRSDDTFSRRYVAHPWLGYLHLVPGIVYLLGASLQLSHRFRSRHYAVHRRMGRVVLAAGLLSGVFAVVFGALHSFGGPVEAAAAVLFGVWFLLCLVRAYVAIRAGDAVTHRRWMIRAFAVGVAVGTIRLWIGLLLGLQLMTMRQAFGPAFWVSFLLHAAVAEWWVRRTPFPGG